MLQPATEELAPAAPGAPAAPTVDAVAAAAAGAAAALRSIVASAGMADRPGWPHSMLTLASLMVAAVQPMFIAWGAERRIFYNDSYAEILGERHPQAFGRPMAAVWFDVWDIVGPIVEKAEAGVATHMADLPLQLQRGGRLQEAHFSFSYTPVRGDDGAVVGLFCVCSEITASVDADRRRAAEEQRRLRLFESAPGFIAILRGPDHVMEFANDAYRRLVGNRELIGRPVRESLPEVGSQGLFDVLDNVFRNNERFVAHALPVLLQHDPDAPPAQRHLDFVYEPIVDEAGSVTGIFVEGSDVTAAVAAQAELRLSHARHKELLDSMAEGFIVMDGHFRVVEINAEGLRMDGRSEQRILQRTPWELWPAAVGTPVETVYRTVMTDRVPVELKHCYLRDGRQQWLQIHAYPVAGGIASLYRDITQTVVAEQALRHSDERFRAAVAAIGVMWTNDRHGRMAGEQPGWAALTGQTEAEYAGYGWAAAVHPDDAGPTVDAWNDAVARQSVFVFEHRVRRHDGAWRKFAIRAVPVMEADGAVREWVGVHIDITEAVLANDALLEANRRKDEFLATLAHELRNPLAPIRTAAALLGMPQLPAERLAWCSRVVQRQSQTMALLLDDLLDVSRITNGRLELRRESVGIASVVAAAVETARHTIDAKQHRLSVLLKVPPEAAVLADPLRLAQVLTNLLNNAAKYTDPGGQLLVEAALQNGAMVFEVVDNGIGIGPEMLPNVFDMFRQVKGALDRSEGGLGIGLALSRGLVELHGGRIEAFSAGLGKGSTFRVTLPAAQQSSADRVAAAEPASRPRAAATAPAVVDGLGAPAAATAADATAAQTQAQAQTLRVLVADDNVDAAETLATLLELQGHQVHLARDGRQAFDVAAQQRPDVAFLDIGMPEVDGYTLAARLREQPWGRPMLLVAVTGWGQDKDKRRARDAGFDSHLTKPLDVASVLRLLAALRPSSGAAAAAAGR